MTRFKTTLRLLIAVFILGIFAWILNNQDVNGRPPRLGYNGRLLNRAFSEVNRVVMTSKDGARQEFLFYDDSWHVNLPIKAQASNGAILELLDAVESAEAFDFFDDNEIKLREINDDDFGLASPSGIIEIFGPRTSLKLTLGRTAAETNEVFAILNGLPGVFVTNSKLLQYINRPIEDFADKHLTGVNIRQIEVVQIERPGESALRIRKSQDRRSWRIVSPEECAADWKEMAAFFKNLANAKLSTLIYHNSTNLEPGVTPSMVINLFTEGHVNPFAITVYGTTDDENGYYLVKNDVGNFATVDATTIKSISLTGNDIRDRRIIPSGPTLDVSEFSLVGPNSSPVNLSRVGSESWYLLSPIRAKANQEVVADILNGFLTLTAQSYIPQSRMGDSSSYNQGPDIKIVTQSITNRFSTGFLRHSDDVQSAVIARYGADFAAITSIEKLEMFQHCAMNPAELINRRLFSFDEKNVLSLTYSLAGRIDETVRRLSSGEWSPKSEASDNIAVGQEVVNGFLSALNNLDALAVEKYLPSTLEEDKYGFANPRLSLSLELHGELVPLVFSVAGFTPDGMGVYAKLSGGDIVYVLSVKDLDIFPQSFYTIKTTPEVLKPLSDNE